MSEEQKKLKDELMKFAEFCKKVGGTSWSDIPESGIDWYIREIISPVDYKAKYKKCIETIKKFDPGIIGMYDL